MADLAGFTALTEAHGDSEAADTAAEFFGASRARLADHQADEVKTLGDAMLLHTVCASAGLGLAVRLVTELGRRDRRLGLRVAVHTGTAVHRDGDWFGAAVNLAARVATVARTGEVVATAAAVQAAGPGVAAQPLGVMRFKNVQSPIELFTVRLPHAPATLAVDPVCRMAVGLDATHRFTHAGREHVFCSLQCLDRFAATPAQYAETLGVG